jgi:hypothetical protein
MHMRSTPSMKRIPILMIQVIIQIHDPPLYESTASPFPRRTGQQSGEWSGTSADFPRQDHKIKCNMELATKSNTTTKAEPTAKVTQRAGIQLKSSNNKEEDPPQHDEGVTVYLFVVVATTVSMLVQQSAG